MKSSWTDLAKRYDLSDQALTSLQCYAKLLQRESQKYNLTTIQEEGDMIAYHIADALEVGKIIDMKNVSCFVDVGSGAGIPGIVLKIAYPSLRAILLEVLGKRRTFLQLVVDELTLSQVIIDERDWRTFLRTSHEDVQLVCARASLAPAELLRMFQPSSPYRHAQLVYWASMQWQPTAREQEFLIKTHTYTVGDRTRVLAIFGEKITLGDCMHKNEHRL